MHARSLCRNLCTHVHTSFSHSHKLTDLPIRSHSRRHSMHLNLSAPTRVCARSQGARVPARVLSEPRDDQRAARWFRLHWSRALSAGRPCHQLCPHAGTSARAAKRAQAPLASVQKALSPLRSRSHLWRIRFAGWPSTGTARQSLRCRGVHLGCRSVASRVQLGCTWDGVRVHLVTKPSDEQASFQTFVFKATHMHVQLKGRGALQEGGLFLGLCPSGVLVHSKLDSAPQAVVGTREGQLPRGTAGYLSSAVHDLHGSSLFVTNLAGAHAPTHACTHTPAYTNTHPTLACPRPCQHPERRTCARACMYAHKCTQAYLVTRTCKQASTHARTCNHARTHARTHAHTKAREPARTQPTKAHAHTRAHTRTHARARTRTRSLLERARRAARAPPSACTSTTSSITRASRRS
eukprot:3407405-Pleurochrysis_carterae.AAC.4